MTAGEIEKLVAEALAYANEKDAARGSDGPGTRYLRLLASALTASEARNKTEERLHTQTLEERDVLQDLFDELYVANFGQAPEYSNLFSATDAFNEMDANLSRLRAASEARGKREGMEIACEVIWLWANGHEDRFEAMNDLTAAIRERSQQEGGE